MLQDIEILKSSNNLKEGSLFEALDLLLLTILRKNISLDDIPDTILYINNSNELKADEIKEYFEKNWFNIRKKPKIKILNLSSNKFKLIKEDNITFIYGYKNKYLKNIIEDIEVDEVEEVREKFKQINYDIKYV